MAIQRTHEYHTGLHKNHNVNITVHITVHADNYLPTKLQWLFCPLGRSCLFWQLTIMRLLPLADGLHSIYAVILSLVLRVKQYTLVLKWSAQTRRRAQEAKDRQEGTQETHPIQSVCIYKYVASDMLIILCVM